MMDILIHISSAFNISVDNVKKGEKDVVIEKEVVRIFSRGRGRLATATRGRGR